MTTIYNLLYPHPSIPLERRVAPYAVDSGTYPLDLVGMLATIHPRHAEDLSSAVLWKAEDVAIEGILDDSATQGLYEWIKERTGSAEVRFPLYLPVERHFPSGPKAPSGDWVHILAVTDEIAEHLGEIGDPFGDYERMKAMGKASAPTEGVKDPDVTQFVLESSAGPWYGRPFYRFGTSTALFSEQLAILRHELEGSNQFPSPSCIVHARQLIMSSAGFYYSGAEREAALRPILQNLISGEVLWQERLDDESTRPDGVWAEGHFGYIIAEIENEPGPTGDPTTQGLVMYSKVLAQNKYEPYIRRSNMPVILLAIAGNRLTVSSAVFADSIYADELVSVKLCFPPHPSKNVLRLARIFAAINRCAGELRKMYQNLAGNNVATPPSGVLWPNPTPDPPRPAGDIPGLRFFSRLNHSRHKPIQQSNIDGEYKQHEMFLAKMRRVGSDDDGDYGANGDTVLIKFAPEYNERAHRILADEDPPLAPKLFSCTRVIGDRFMVVMEYIPEFLGKPLDRITPPRDALGTVREDISRALGLLHGEELVFGDLREQNILYLPDHGRILLVDFDGAGRDGEDRYSVCLDQGAGLGVLPLEVMKKSDDDDNLERLMKRLED